MPFDGKPILGVVGGIASGKSTVSRMLAELGCCVIDSDALAHSIYQRPETVRVLREWYGPTVITPAGQVDRRAVGAIVFRDPDQRVRLEGLLHPLINAERITIMQRKAADPAVRAFVWDSPLLIEAGLHKECDAVIFVDTPIEIRQQRASQSRGWSAAELERRENAQLSLREKRQAATDLIDGTLTPEPLRSQLDALLTALTRRISQ